MGVRQAGGSVVVVLEALRPLVPEVGLYVVS